ncbi:CBS domain-containing protein, partial [Acinetobacter baumannii]
MSRKGMGMTCVVDDQQRLLGIFTDGDLRRSLDKGLNIHTTPIHEVMTMNCKTICSQLLAVEALNLMQHHKIMALIITD